MKHTKEVFNSRSVELKMQERLNKLRAVERERQKQLWKEFDDLKHRADEMASRTRELHSLLIVADIPVGKESSFMKLSFGGDYIDIAGSTLLLFPERNGLIALHSGKYVYLLPKDQNGRVFFDLSRRYVDPLFNYCRDLAMWSGDESTKPTIAGVENKRFVDENAALRQYFSCSELTSPQQQQRQKHHNVLHDSMILGELECFDEELLFDMFADKSQSFSATLLYRGSRDGWLPEDYHNHCLNKPNTLSIIRDTSGNVFGGFTSVCVESVTKEVVYTLDTKAFLFTLAVKSEVKPARHNLLSGARSCVAHSIYSAVCFIDSNKNGSSDLDILGQCGWGRLGGAFDATDCRIDHWVSDNKSFTVDEIEVFQLHQKRKSCTGNSELESCAEELHKQEVDLLNEAETVIAELLFVAKHCGVSVPPRPPVDSTADSVVDFSVYFDTALSYIRDLNFALQSSALAVTAVTTKVVDTVKISAGGRLITTTKDTLRQAPEGSPLANMASDAWGHNLDSDGNIYQDVNSELFVAIINHLRLKQLLNGTSIQVPPIVVYEEQKTALDNLLSFYMLTDLPVHKIQEIIRFLSDSSAKNPTGNGSS